MRIVVILTSLRGRRKASEGGGRAAEAGGVGEAEGRSEAKA